MAKLADDLRRVLAAEPEAQARWNDLTPIGRRDFVNWIDSAKKPETRKRRVASVPGRLASGKRRPCCYAVVPLALHTALKRNAEAKANWKGLTPDQKRDFTDWIEAAPDKRERDRRIAKSAASIAAGEKRP